MGRLSLIPSVCLAIALAATARGDDLDTVAARIKSDLTSAASSTSTTNGLLSSLGADGRWSRVSGGSGISTHEVLAARARARAQA